MCDKTKRVYQVYVTFTEIWKKYLYSACHVFVSVFMLFKYWVSLENVPNGVRHDNDVYF